MRRSNSAPTTLDLELVHTLLTDGGGNETEIALEACLNPIEVDEATHEGGWERCGNCLHCRFVREWEIQTGLRQDPVYAETWLDPKLYKYPPKVVHGTHPSFRWRVQRLQELLEKDPGATAGKMFRWNSRTLYVNVKGSDGKVRWHSWRDDDQEWVRA